MLKINRLRIEIKTKEKVFGFDETFQSGLNLIASDDNTRGKSSIIAMIYYCLGFEEIIGGRGEKVLTAAFKSIIEEGENVWTVLESGAYLEITNGMEVITIFRAAKMENRDNRLISVYYSDMENIHRQDTLMEDMYVHMPNAANNKKGFHNFLETFLHFELPLVPASDDAVRKLYLQLIFSGMFIEQKHGWADILAGMPILGIKESKKRVIEFILNLDTLDNERKKDHLRSEEDNIKKEWTTVVRDITLLVEKEACSITGLPLSPKILTDLDYSKITIQKGGVHIDEYINDLTEKYNDLQALKPKIIDNFEELQIELNETEVTIREYERDITKLRDLLDSEHISIRRLQNNLEIIKTDINNNKDAARLRNLGSGLDLYTSKDICPTCHQDIADTLLPLPNHMPIMSIDDNIRHLNAQKDMLEFAMLSHKSNSEQFQSSINLLEGNLFKLRSLAKSLRSDLYQTNDSYSEAIVYKRLSIESEISNLNKLLDFYSNHKVTLEILSDRWKDYLEKKAALPENKYSQKDQIKLNHLQEYFVDNIRKFGYKSVSNLNQVEVSKENYLPAIEGFDMKFDSSASDNIRAIWAFTLALLQVSSKDSGNHPGILIFDEPAQHSIVVNDMEEFLTRIINDFNKNQVIIGITVKDSDTRRVVSELPEGKYKLIMVPNKAFQKIDKSL
ncbi:hypothetical protein COLU111180_01825 [Cohnella lubricantis]|uniref:Rad50/SbcC-type AAA domain-containing protein n=1 Tax=Cohnella lubricantis TaxID=2163172 RepID=A0A841T8F1_9BACL|nr:hypothetical protein [Cohnella lubricantis]MBB6676285.1 hypothetical protein [Cohnella lubricantis]MBP2117315.1 cupin superfamily acireductone dioxygenase involved in methionine salvage [Cohnella lubricantis]